MKVTFKKIPFNTPEICGNCNVMGINCTCVCHVEAIVRGFHENIQTAKPLEFDTAGKIAHFFKKTFRLKFKTI